MTLNLKASGRALAGSLVRTSERPAGVAVYDVASNTARMINSDPAYWAVWLPDSRRSLYVTTSRKMIVVDTVSGKRTVVDVTLPGIATGFARALSPDGKTFFYGAQRSESDIWIVERSTR